MTWICHVKLDISHIINTQLMKVPRTRGVCVSCGLRNIRLSLGLCSLLFVTAILHIEQKQGLKAKTLSPVHCYNSDFKKPGILWGERKSQKKLALLGSSCRKDYYNSVYQMYRSLKHLKIQEIYRNGILLSHNYFSESSSLPYFKLNPYAS